MGKITLRLSPDIAQDSITNILRTLAPYNVQARMKKNEKGTSTTLNFPENRAAEIVADLLEKGEGLQSGSCEVVRDYTFAICLLIIGVSSILISGYILKTLVGIVANFGWNDIPMKHYHVTYP